MLWLIKILFLILGIFWQPLGVALIIMDGKYHYESSQETLEKTSPDWIIARNLFGINGMGRAVHLIMGLLLILSSVIYIWTLVSGTTKFKKTYQKVYKIMMIVVLVIIASGIFIKNVISKDKDNAGDVAGF